MNIESVFIWEDAKVNLPPTNNHASDYILFTFLEEVHCGFLDHSGYFRSSNNISTTAIAIAAFQPEGEKFCDGWQYNLDNEDLPIVSRWIYLKDTYPKLDSVKDKIIRVYENKLYGEEEISSGILKRSIELVTELYKADKLNFKEPSYISSGGGNITLSWIGKNDRTVNVIFTHGNDYLTCDSINLSHEFFPFTIDKLIHWLTWLSK